MPLPEMSIVSLDLIPSPPYSTPAHDLPLLYSTAKRMESLCVKMKGLGLASAQVGLPWRMFVANPFGEEFQFYFDCEYEPLPGESHRSVEGCLSVPGAQYAVSRHESVLVSGMRLLEGKEGPEAESFSADFHGLMAVLMQHEIDHDHGREKMIDVIGTRVFPSWR